MLEVIPRQWKVIQHVREKFTCRDCEKISQAPAPFHVLARGWAGPSLLAMILFEKFGQRQPLNGFSGCHFFYPYSAPDGLCARRSALLCQSMTTPGSSLSHSWGIPRPSWI
jgi:transposase